MQAPIWAAVLTGVIALIVLVVNARRAFRDASWKRVETGLNLIASGETEKERIGWLILNRQIADDSLSPTDAELVTELAADLADEDARADESANGQRSSTVDVEGDEGSTS